VLVLAVVAVVVAALGWIGLLAGAHGARGRAQTAADLGALAGAQHRSLGGTDACEVAARTGQSNGAEMTACVTGASLDVTVEAAVRTVVGPATAEARAGPRAPPGRALVRRAHATTPRARPGPARLRDTPGTVRSARHAVLRTTSTAPLEPATVSGCVVMDMTRSGARLLTIGEFSRLARISVRMLRHYDDRGLLLPVDVDPANGYRRYSPHQLRTVDRIHALRDAGFSVAEMVDLLPRFAEAAQMRTVLEQQRDRLAADADVVRRRIEQVDHLITALKEPIMSVQVTRSTMPARTVAALRGVVPGYADEGLLWQRLMPGLFAAGARLSETPQVGATFHDEEYVDHDPEIEVWATVASPFAAQGDVRCVELPEQDVVSATITGPYEQVSGVMAALGDWVSANDVALDGPMFNVYLVGPEQEKDPQRWVTQVCLPVRDL
jgi:secretion/DNA translocation related TadE-like protein